jgi:hypothetical protein
VDITSRWNVGCETFIFPAIGSQGPCLPEITTKMYRGPVIIT